MGYKKEEIQINQRTPGVTLADGVANVDSEIAVYIVPAKSAIKLRPTDFIGIHLADSAGTELVNTSLVTILATDPNNRETEVIAQGEYAQFKAMVNALEKYYLKTTKVISAYYRLVIKVLASTAADDAQTRFTVTTLLGRETL